MILDRQLKEAEMQEAKQQAYEQHCPASMNRADRRTAKGRMLVAQAEAASLRAELELLKERFQWPT